MKKSKKGVSLMVSYTLLIVIAVGLSVVVYTYLKLWLPSQRPECPLDISLIIEKATCNVTSEELVLTLSNRGLFNVSAAFIRMGEEGRRVRQQVNKNQEIFFGGAIPPSSNPAVYNYTITDILSASTSSNFIIEVQPAIIERRAPYPCERSIITQPIICE